MWNPKFFKKHRLQFYIVVYYICKESIMANRILKYPLVIGDNKEYLPVGYKPLSVVCQRGNIVLYCIVDKDQEFTEEAIFEVVMTGQPMVEAGKHVFIGTVSTNVDGTFILHVFERKNAVS